MAPYLVPACHASVFYASSGFMQACWLQLDRNSLFMRGFLFMSRSEETNMHWGGVKTQTFSLEETKVSFCWRLHLQQVNRSELHRQGNHKLRNKLQLLGPRERQRVWRGKMRLMLKELPACK